MNFKPGDRVLVTGPPTDIKDAFAYEGRGGVEVFQDKPLPGTIIRQRMNPQGTYEVHFDRDLVELRKNQWRVNDLFIPEEMLVAERIPQEEVDEALASIQEVIQRSAVTSD